MGDDDGTEVRDVDEFSPIAEKHAAHGALPLQLSVCTYIRR